MEKMIKITMIAYQSQYEHQQRFERGYEGAGEVTPIAMVLQNKCRFDDNSPHIIHIETDGDGTILRFSTNEENTKASLIKQEEDSDETTDTPGWKQRISGRINNIIKDIQLKELTSTVKESYKKYEVVKNLIDFIVDSEIINCLPF